MKDFSDADSAGGTAGPKLSDNDSVRTEDFANKFSQMLVGADAAAAGRQRVRVGDADSVRTEDFAREFHRAMTVGDSPQARPRPAATGYRPLSSLRASAPLLLREPDVDSVKTEDFENKFRSMLVRGPPPPVAAYDDSYISSSDSAVKAQLLRERVGKLFRVPPSGVRLPQDPLLDSDAERRHLLMRARQRECYAPPLKSSPPKVLSLTATRLSTSPTRSDGRQRSRAPLGRISPIREVPTSSFHRDELEDEDFLADDEEFAQEVRYQSRLIQRELEMERRKRAARERSASPLRHGTTPRESLDRKVLELDELNSQVRKTLQEKEKILAELHFVQDCLRKHQAEVRLSEKLCKDNKSKAEDTKTELMLAEMKRDSTAKELDFLGDELQQKKGQLKQMEETCKKRTKELQDLENIGIAKEEIENILTERDELYQLIRQNEDAEYQRYELEKQLTQTREEMLAQATVAQQKVIALEEELEASLTKIAETTEERNALKMRMGDMDEKLRLVSCSLDELAETNRRLLRAKEIAERERSEEMEQLKLRMQGDLAHIQRRTEDEEQSHKRQIQQLKENLADLQQEVERKDEAACSLREQLLRLESQLGHEAETKSHLLTETERHLQKTEAEAGKKLQEARDAMRREAEEKLAREKSQWQQEKAQELQASQGKHQREVTHLEYQLGCKEDELQSLRDALKSKQAELQSQEEEHRAELRERVRAALRAEREKADRDGSDRWRRELAALKEETARTIDSLQAENKKKAEAIRALEEQQSVLTAASEKDREKAKTAQREKLAAIARIKEVAKEETAKELQNVRSRVEAVAYEELERTKEQLKSSEAALQSLRAELEATARRETELAVSLEKVERAVVQQINSECARTAIVLGVSPRRVANPSSHRQLHDGAQTEAAQPSSRSLSAASHPITAALANLEACCEELRAYTAEMQDQIQRQKERLDHELKAKEQEVLKVKSELSEEKSSEVQSLRERLIKEHMEELAKLAKANKDTLEASLTQKEAEVAELKENMKKWKNETAERLAVRLQDEFRREFDKKIRDLRNTVRSKDQEIMAFRKELESFEIDMGKSHVQQQQQQQQRQQPMIFDSAGRSQLQERVKLLRDENTHLRKAVLHKPQALGQQLPSRQLSGSLTSLHRLDAVSSNGGGGGGTEGYAQQLESKLRALEERVRRAERQNELLDKDRINSLTKKELLLGRADAASALNSGRDSLR